MNIIKCPNCSQPLVHDKQSMRCENGHSFDIAKEGYTNLILPNQKKKLNSGDNKLMISAREEFLSMGYYDFLIGSIEKEIIALSQIDKGQHKQLLDLGCGNGYYTRKLLNDQATIHKFGIDISKIAVTTAAKKDKNSIYIVGSNFDIPIMDDSVDIIVNVFAPCDLIEVLRVLKPKGLFVKVIPIDNHMTEVAKLVYETFIPHESDITKEIEATERLTVVSTKNVIKEIEVQKVDIHNLIKMTPYYYKFSEQQIQQLEMMSVTLSFQIIIAKLK